MIIFGYVFMALAWIVFIGLIVKSVKEAIIGGKDNG